MGEAVYILTTNMNKKKVIYRWIAIAIIVIVLVLYIPIMKKNHQIRVLNREILKVQAEIDLNSAKREECAVNMATWNADNDNNRAIKEQMISEYEELVGFRWAGQ